MAIKLWLFWMNYTPQTELLRSALTSGSPAGFSVPGSVLQATLEPRRLLAHGLAPAWTRPCLEAGAEGKTDNKSPSLLSQSGAAHHRSDTSAICGNLPGLL